MNKFFLSKDSFLCFQNSEGSLNEVAFYDNWLHSK